MYYFVTARNAQNGDIVIYHDVISCTQNSIVLYSTCLNYTATLDEKNVLYVSQIDSWVANKLQNCYLFDALTVVKSWAKTETIFERSLMRGPGSCSVTM